MDIIKKLLLKIDQKKKTPSERVATHDVEVFYYPHEGIHVLPENLAKRVTQAQGNIILDCRITNIELNPNNVITYIANNIENKVAFDYLVSTIPINDYAALLTPPVEMSIKKAIDSLKSRALIFVFLMINSENEIFESQWIYFYDKTFTRMSETKKFSARLVPEGKTGICIEISCDVDDDIYKADDEFIYEFILKDLLDTEIVSEEDIEGYLIAREPNAYVVYLKNYKDNMENILAYFNGLGNIFFCGRQGLFKYINMDQAIESGLNIADKIIKLETSS
jgi:protoporphyrinogen oxidase